MTLNLAQPACAQFVYVAFCERGGCPRCGMPSGEQRECGRRLHIRLRPGWCQSRHWHTAETVVTANFYHTTALAVMLAR